MGLAGPGRETVSMRLFAIAAIGAGLAFAAPALATRVFTTIPQPSGTDYVGDGSAGWGVSPTGDIVGAFFEEAGGDEAGAEGFIDISNTVTILNFPNAFFTVWHGLDKTGTLIGEAGVNGISGVIRSATGTFTAYDYPGATYTRFTGINGKGVISGNYYNGDFHGLIYKSGHVTVFNYPGASDTACTAINNSGEVAGNYTTAGVTHAYYLVGSTATSFDVSGATYTDARAINDNGVIAGFWIDSANTNHGFIRSKTGVITKVNYPSAYGTKIFGLNDKGEISGEWMNAAGQWFPFYAVPQ